MSRTTFHVAIAAQIMLLAGSAFAQPSDRTQPRNQPSGTPSQPAQPAQTDRGMDPAERERMQKEWDGLKKDWDALTPEVRILSVIHAKNLKEVELGRLGQQKGTRQEVKEFAAMMVKEHTEADSKLTSLASSENISLWDTTRTDRALMLKKIFDKEKDGSDKNNDRNRNNNSGNNNNNNNNDNIGDNNRDRQPTDRPTTTNPDQPRPASPSVPGNERDRDMRKDASHDRASMKDPAEKLRGLSGEDFDNTFGKLMYHGHSELLSMLEKHGGEVTNANVKAYVNEVTTTVRHHRDSAAKLPGANTEGKDKDKDGKHGRDTAKPGTTPGTTDPSSPNRGH